MRNFRRKSIRPSAPNAIAICTTVAARIADRVGVDLVFAVEVRREHDQQHDDHDVPHRRGDRRDREFVIGLQDPHEQARQAEQQHDGEQHLGEAHRQVISMARARTDEQRHDHAGGEDEERR